LTCQVNERWVLNDPDVRKKFSDKGIVMLKADWTLRDDEISEALSAFGRSGVPVYVLYKGKGHASPELLPEILTKNRMLKALDEVET